MNDKPSPITYLHIWPKIGAVAKEISGTCHLMERLCWWGMLVGGEVVVVPKERLTGQELCVVQVE